MNHQRRSTLAIGLVLVLLGAWFLIVQLVPGLKQWVEITFAWPLFVIAAGLLLLLIGLLGGVPAMAIPASVLAGIGALLYWQNATGNWDSWAYAWALIPGFVGVGTFLAGLLGDHRRQNLRGGINLSVVSLVLFAIFASFLGGWNLFGPYWPVLLILLGLWLLLRPWIRARVL